MTILRSMIPEIGPRVAATTTNFAASANGSELSGFFDQSDISTS